MIQITSITNAPKQRIDIPFGDGETIIFRLYFMPTQYSWYYDFEYNDYASYGNKVVLTYNSLRHLKNILPFGFAFLSESKVEPYSIEDFSSDRIRMYLLDKEEIQEIEENVYYV